MVGRALQGSCERGSPWSFVCVPPATRAGPAVLTTRRRTAVATRRVLNVNTGTRRVTSDSTNRRRRASVSTKIVTHPPRARAAGRQWLTTSYQALPQPSRGDRPPGASSQRRAHLCPGAGERPPSDSSASRGERLATRAGAPAAARACLEQPLRLCANKQKREMAMSAAALELATERWVGHLDSICARVRTSQERRKLWRS